MKKEHIVFVTGRLAETALRKILEKLSLEVGFEYSVVVLEISVAALMSPAFVARRLQKQEGVDRVVLPGYCRGDLGAIEASVGVSVERGPKDLRVLPRWFAGVGETASPEDYGEHRIEILAEINHAPDLSHGEILELARRYRDDGADVIDVGCNPDGAWIGLDEVVKMLVAEGHRVAVDSFDAREIVRGVEAGAELVLSVHRKNREVARDLDCEVVAIPDDPHTLDGLDETVALLAEWKVPHRIDPVIEPIGFGFATSLRRYMEVRERYPDSRMLMGIGNISELTDVDSAGVNALLVAICAELGIQSVLTTEVIPWARSSVREIDIARRLMHYAVSREVLPKHLDDRLICLRDPEPTPHGDEVLADLARRIKDPSYRIFAENGKIHLMNRDLHVTGTDAFELFEDLSGVDPSHAFYLGYEMAKASIALCLGKQYHQDRALRWGFLTVEETSAVERRKQHKDGEKSD